RGDPERPLVRLGVLDPGLEPAGSAATELAGPAADVLRQMLVLIGLRLVRDVGGCRRGRVLRRRARAGGDVPTGGRGGRVAVDGVLVARGDPERALVRVRVLDPDLEATGTATARDAAA